MTEVNTEADKEASSLLSCLLLKFRIADSTWPRGVENSAFAWLWGEGGGGEFELEVSFLPSHAAVSVSSRNASP